MCCTGLKPPVDQPSFYCFTKQAETSYRAIWKETSLCITLFIHSYIWKIVIKESLALFFSVSYIITGPSLKTLKLCLHSYWPINKCTWLFCVARQRQPVPGFYIWKTSMLPIWRLTGCSVNETSHDAFLIKTLQASEKGCTHCMGSLLTGNGDRIDFHV